MKEFITQNWLVLLMAVIFLGYIIYLTISRQWTRLRELAYALMLQAERIFSEGEGKEKFLAVYERLYIHLIPDWMRLFVTPTDMRRKLQEWYDLAKDYLDNGTIDNSTD